MTAPTSTRPFRFCASADLPEGRVRSALIGGPRRRGHAAARPALRLRRTVPAQQADLALGLLEHGAITCADHLWRFELATGRCTSVPGARGAGLRARAR